MADTVATLVAKLEADTAHFDRNMKSATATLKRFAGPAAIGAAALAVGKFAASSVKSAARLAESMNAVEVVFGSAAGKVKAFADTSIDSVGLAASTVNEAAVVLGSALQNAGLSADEAADKTLMLTKRAADMASVFNTDVSQALGAMQSALRGESNPIERFGVSMAMAAVEAKALEMGYDKVGGSFTNTALTAARMALIMEQTEKVAGDYANTADSVANQQKRLTERWEQAKAEIGEGLLPAASDLLGVLEDMLPAFVNVGTSAVDAFADATVAAKDFFQAISDGPDPLTNESTIGDLFAEAIAGAIKLGRGFSNLMGEIADEFKLLVDPPGRTMRLGIEAMAGRWERAGEVMWGRQQQNMYKDYADGLRRAMFGVSHSASWMVSNLVAGLDATSDAAGDSTVVWTRYGENMRRVMGRIRMSAEDAAVGLRDVFADVPDQITDSLKTLEKRMTQKEALGDKFYTNLAVLAAAGMDDLIGALMKGGLEVTGTVEDLAEDMDRAWEWERRLERAAAMGRAYAMAVATGIRNPDALRAMYDAMIVLLTAGEAAFLGFRFPTMPSLGSLFANPDTTFKPPTVLDPSRILPGGSFDDGGVVPGPRGAPRSIVAHGGETILPTHKTGGGNTFNATINVTSSDPATIVRGLERELRRMAEQVV